MKLKKAVVILPCLNEERTVGKVIGKLRNVSNKLKIKFIIIAIDDFSDDNTVKILNKKADKVISLEKRKSLAKVIKIGLKESLKYKPGIIIHIDADDQYNPFELTRLINPIRTGEADFVIGNRNIWKLKHMSLVKKIGNVFFSKLVSFITKKNIKDAQSGFRVMSYNVAKKLEIKSSYTYTQEELIKVLRLGYKIKQIKVSFRARKFGKSRLIRTPFIYGIRVLLDLMRI